MGEAAHRLSANGDEPREQAESIDEELKDLRHELSTLVDELDRRREALDPRVQIRQHPLKGAVAGGLLGVASGLVFVLARRRRQLRAAPMALASGSPPDRASSIAPAR